MTVHRPTAVLLLLLVALCLASTSSAGSVPAAAPAPSAWTISCIDCPKRFDPPGDHYLQFDSACRAHLAYGGDALYYAVRDAGGWHTETVDPAPGAGMAAALALDPAGQPTIAYYDRGSGNLKSARRTGAGWQIETIDAADATHSATSLVVDVAGRPHVAYFATTHDEYGNTTTTARYAYRDSSGWHPSTIGRAAWDGGAISLALSSSGTPAVAYTTSTIDEAELLGYARLEADGWQTTALATPALGQDLALAFDAGNRPHILFFFWDDPNNTAALYYTRWDGSGWATEQVDHERRIKSVSLRLDAAGQPNFAGHSPYVDRSRDGLPSLEGYAWYGWRDAAGWHFDAVSAGGAYPDLAWGPDASLSVAYLQGDASLDLAQPGPYGGWAVETVDRQEPLSGPIALAVDRQGRPQVAYKGHDVYHARLAAGGWQPEAIFGSAASAETLAIDSLVQPHLAVVELYRPQIWAAFPWRYRLWYASRPGGAWQRSVIDNSAGHMPVIAIDRADRVHLAYVYAHPEGMDSELRYVRDGQAMPVAKAHAFANLSMAVDSHDSPHIADMDDSYRITYRIFDGAAWQSELVGPPPEAALLGAVLALDPADRAAVAYIENASATRLLLTTRTASGWQVETVRQVDAGVGIGSGIDLAFDASGTPHIVFWLDGRLQHAWRGAQGWQFQAIDPATTAGGAFDLVSGPDGQLLVAYVDALSNDARLADLRVGPGPLFLPLILR